MAEVRASAVLFISWVLHPYTKMEKMKLNRLNTNIAYPPFADNR